MPTFLSGTEISDLRSDVEEFLTWSAVILRDTYTSDGMGGSVAALGTAGTVSCRLSPLSQELDETGGAVDGLVLRAPEWMVTVPALTDIRPMDRLDVVEGTVPALEVLRLRQPSTYEPVRQVECAEVS